MLPLVSTVVVYFLLALAHCLRSCSDVVVMSLHWDVASVLLLVCFAHVHMCICFLDFLSDIDLNKMLIHVA